MKLNKYIDHTLLKATATEEEIIQLCKEAREHNFFSVCINSSYVSLAARELKGSDVKVCAVVGFPLGAMSKEAKIFEAKDSVLKGADEIDMVINIGFLKGGRLSDIYDEIKGIKEIIGVRTLKVIIETCYLTDEEKREACREAVKAGADFVKTSTGFGTGGATFEDVKLMLETVKGEAKVKASGGVKDTETAKKYISMGVERLGTSSGIKLVMGENIGAGEY